MHRKRCTLVTEKLLVTCKHIGRYLGSGDVLTSYPPRLSKRAPQQCHPIIHAEAQL
jgi:hypothetical protein